MYTIYFDFRGKGGFVQNIDESALEMMEQIISRRAFIVFVERQS
jgi:hypothetical protein